MGKHLRHLELGFHSAQLAGELIGGAVIAFSTPSADLLEGRLDLAVLWDIRVSPDVRGRGVGSALFRAVETWATGKGCKELKVETQNINVAACRFYARHGCVLRAADRSAYPQFPGEVQLLWYKNLTAAGVAQHNLRAGSQRFQPTATGGITSRG